MGIISSLIDAIRRVGSPSQRSALKRQDQYLADKTVLDRRLQPASADQGTALQFVATIEPVAESSRPFAAAELSAVEEGAAEVHKLFERFLNVSISSPTPAQLDDLFTAWAHSPDRSAVSDEEIVGILGAAFGQYCTEALEMGWIMVTDSDGSSAAIQGIRKDFRGYPFHSIRKRIAAGEHEFFASIYNSMAATKGSSREVPGVS